VGGNLALLAALAGTPSAPDCDGGVLFLEDVNEPLYRLDRQLTQLSQSSRLARVSAIVAGRFLGCGAGEPHFRDRLRALLAEAAPPGAVVVEGVPFGHGTVNVPFPIGVEVTVDTEGGVIGWGGT
jgi:muramoyltetrapeptide carboxypeptidase